MHPKTDVNETTDAFTKFNYKVSWITTQNNRYLKLHLLFTEDDPKKNNKEIYKADKLLKHDTIPRISENRKRYSSMSTLSRVCTHKNLLYQDESRREKYRQKFWHQSFPRRKNR